MYHRIYALIFFSFCLIFATGWGFWSGRGSIQGGTGLPVFISAGNSNSYTDTTGQVWSPDGDASGGQAGLTLVNVTNTADPSLFQHFRTATTGSIIYSIPITGGGLFRVSELESELTTGFVQGSRTQNITLSCDGTAVATHLNFDILDPNGACGGAAKLFRACTISDWVPCGSRGDNTAHTLNVRFDAVVGQPIVDGITIIPQNPAVLTQPTPIPTPGQGPVILVPCAGMVGTGALQLTTTISTGQSLWLFHEGAKGQAANPGVTDTKQNGWASIPSINTNSQGCLNGDYVLSPNGLGSDTVTALSPGTGLLNAAILCNISSLASVDVGNSGPLTAYGINVRDASITPTVTADNLLGIYYAEATSPAFSGSSINAVGTGTPTDIALQGTTSSGTQLIGAVQEFGTINTTAQTQRGVTPAGNYCGATVALSSTAIAKTSLTVTPVNPSISIGGQQKFTATITLANGNTEDWSTANGTTWISSNTGTATMAANVAMGVAGGTTTITAQNGSLSGSTVLAVAPNGNPNPPALSTPFVIIAAGTQPQLSTGGTAVSCTTAGNDSATPPFCGGGVTDDSACFQSALALGHDVQINAGHYCINSVQDTAGNINSGFAIPTGVNVRCGSGTGSASDWTNISLDTPGGGAAFSISDMRGGGSVFGCSFRSLNYSATTPATHPNGTSGNVNQSFIGIWGSQGSTVANNDFNGIGGFLAAVAINNGGAGSPVNLIEFNHSENCGHYFVQVSGSDHTTIDHNTLQDCNCCVEGIFTFTPHIIISNGTSTYINGSGWDFNSGCPAGGCGAGNNYVDMSGESGAVTNCDFSQSSISNYTCNGSGSGSGAISGLYRSTNSGCVSGQCCPTFSVSNLTATGQCSLIP